MRSGGHGYNCNSIKNGSVHFDLRRISHVQLIKDHYTHVSIYKKKTVFKID